MNRKRLIRELALILKILAIAGALWKIPTWFSKATFEQQAQADRLDKMEERQSIADDRWQVVSNRLAHIDGVLEEMRRNGH